MSVNTSIEWTDSTWNCLRGCTRVSEGCRNCYAEKVAYRFSGEGLPYAVLAVLKNGHPSWTGKVEFIEKHLLDPLKWGSVLTGIRNGEGILREKAHKDGSVTLTRERPRRIFVNSMSDLFHEAVTDEMRDKIFAVMALCPHHTFQVLTKRPERMLEYLERIADLAVHDVWKWQQAADLIVDNCAVLEDHAWPLPNVWLGVSVENQAAADARIPLLLQTPAAVRFISAEPLLGEIRLERVRMPETLFGWHDINVLSGNIYRHARQVGFGHPKLDWVICGGESGPGARPMEADWARSLRDQCASAGVPFFMKQMGSVFGPKKGHKAPDDLNIKQFPGSAHA